MAVVPPFCPLLSVSYISKREMDEGGLTRWRWQTNQVALGQTSVGERATSFVTLDLGAAGESCVPLGPLCRTQSCNGFPPLV